jgi:hypothetical protein
MGGRSGIARGLSSAEVSGFFCSAAAAEEPAGAAAFASGSAGAPAGGRAGGAIGTPRRGGSTGFASAADLFLAGAVVSAGAGVSAGFGAFAVSSTDVSPPKYRRSFSALSSSIELEWVNASVIPSS